MKVKKIKIELPIRDKEEIDFYKSLVILAKIIYEKRMALDLTQKDLAIKAGTTQRIISNIENAELNIGIKLLFKITKVLDLNLKLNEISLLNNDKTEKVLRGANAYLKESLNTKLLKQEIAH
ncbi:MAG: helix-turn-helix transcriptional regulator [Fusobacteriaceae bacterium]|nr:helix-turn-helix transcriptional regulator [Fusobacteriaceae bacterium]